MCQLSHKTSLLTSVKMFPSDHALCRGESKKMSAVGTVMFIHSLSFSASGFSCLAFLTHLNDLAAVKEFSPGVFQTAIRSSFLSAASF